jgi:hypothetical protein
MKIKLFHVLLAIILVVVFANTSVAAVGYTVTFQTYTYVSGSGHLTVEIYVQKTGSTNFRVGNANFWFSYTATGIGTPTVAAHGAYNVTLDNDYLAATLTSGTFSGKQYVSYNTFFNTDGVTGNDQQGTIPSTSAPGTLVCRIDFAVTNPSKTVDFAFQTSGFALTTDVSGDITANGNWTSTVLPVELTSFTASASHLTTQLNWKTATEINNYGFDVERRTVSNQPSAISSWAKVGFVNGNGTSNSPHEYSYSDNGIASGRYAYRIKQVDNDGIFKYSQSAEVEIGLAAKEFTLSSNYPNPFNPTTNIDFTVAADGKAVLKVYNTLGQEVAELYNGEAQAGRIIQTHFDASRLSSGIYFSRLEADGKSLVKQMMFIK